MSEVRLSLRINDSEKKAIAKLAEDNNMTETEYIIYRTLTINPQNPDNDDHEYCYELPTKERHEYFKASALAELRIMLQDLMMMKYSDTWDELKARMIKESKGKLSRGGYRRIKVEK